MRRTGRLRAHAIEPIIPANAKAVFKKNREKATQPLKLFNPKLFRWSMLGVRERRAMHILVDHVADCKIAHRARVKMDTRQVVIPCTFPGCTQMCQLLWHNLDCEQWGTGGGDPMDQLIELYSNKEPKKLNKRNMNRMAQMNQEKLAELAQDERARHALPMQGCWCTQCRECDHLQRLHREHCHLFRKICYIPGCGGPSIPTKEKQDIFTPKYETHLVGVAKLNAWVNARMKGGAKCLVLEPIAPLIRRPSARPSR